MVCLERGKLPVDPYESEPVLRVPCPVDVFRVNPGPVQRSQGAPVQPAREKRLGHYVPKYCALNLFWNVLVAAILAIWDIPCKEGRPWGYRKAE